MNNFCAVDYTKRQFLLSTILHIENQKRINFKRRRYKHEESFGTIDSVFTKCIDEKFNLQRRQYKSISLNITYKPN